MHHYAESECFRLRIQDSIEVGGPDWEEVKEIYASARELTGMFVMTDEGPLEMRNPWDPPDAADAMA